MVRFESVTRGGMFGSIAHFTNDGMLINVQIDEDNPEEAWYEAVRLAKMQG